MSGTSAENAENCRLWRLSKRTEKQRLTYNRRSVLEQRLKRIWRRTK